MNKSIAFSRTRIPILIATLAAMIFASTSTATYRRKPGHKQQSSPFSQYFKPFYGCFDYFFHKPEPEYFERIATFPVFQNSSIESETVSEIVAATADGKTLAYTDSQLEAIGFVDISNPYDPQPDGIVALGGEPTSVAILGKYVLAAVVDKDSEFTAPKGQLEVIDIRTREIVASIDLGGQPDAIAISPSKRYAAIVIENERDEDEGDGRPGQEGNPPGKIVIVDLKGKPWKWTTRDVSLIGISEKFPNDPEPEFVDINRYDIAAVSMQEDNHIVLIHLPTGIIINDFSAGTVDLSYIDATEDDLMNLVESLQDIPREPDAITWLGDWRIGTADEGDLDGGSRGFTIFDFWGNLQYSSGNTLDQLTAMIGHYPESRSENKGSEPEGIEYATYGRDDLLFVGSERASVVAVYKIGWFGIPNFVQVLPAGIGPEGLLAIPQRDLFVSASEEDSRDDKFRGSITIYKRKAYEPSYPTIASLDRPEGGPIPWAALSALAADPQNAARAWTVYDSYYQKSRIFELDVAGSPTLITKEIVIKDTNGAFEALLETLVDEDLYPDLEISSLINADLTINVDPEGLARRADGGFWVASEGAGTAGDEEARPIESRNWIFKVSNSGDIEEVVGLPDDTNARQRRFGFEGVTSIGSGADEVVYVCIQREWGVDADGSGRDPAGHARIGRYETNTGEWTFFYYPLDPRESAFGGWVGLSEIVALDDENFLMLERDDQAGADAAIKRIYSFSIAGLTPLAEAPYGETPTFPVVEKTLVRDLMPDLAAPKGAIIEKVEGLAVLANGDAIIVTDNDGVDDSNGETQFINLGPLGIE